MHAILLLSALAVASANPFCGICEHYMKKHIKPTMVQSIYNRAAPAVCRDVYKDNLNCTLFMHAMNDYIVTHGTDMMPHLACVTMNYCQDGADSNTELISKVPEMLFSQPQICKVCLNGMRYIQALFVTSDAAQDFKGLLDNACLQIPNKSSAVGCQVAINGVLGAITGAVTAAITPDICYENGDCITTTVSP